jgi:PAS domain-containing protein
VSPAEFQRYYSVLPDPMLLVSANAEIVAVNPAAAEFLGLDAASRNTAHLTAVVAEPVGRTLDFLSRCRRTTDLNVTSIAVRRPGGPAIPCRAEGAMMTRPPEEPLILLRVLANSSFTSGFVALNVRIDALNREIA